VACGSDSSLPDHIPKPASCAPRLSTSYLITAALRCCFMFRAAWPPRLCLLTFAARHYIAAAAPLARCCTAHKTMKPRRDRWATGTEGQGMLFGLYSCRFGRSIQRYRTTRLPKPGKHHCWYCRRDTEARHCRHTHSCAIYTPYRRCIHSAATAALGTWTGMGCLSLHLCLFLHLHQHSAEGWQRAMRVPQLPDSA